MNAIGENIYKGFKPLKKDVQGWNSEHHIFKELIERVNPKVIIEVGTWKGASAITMCNAVKELGLETKMYCVDTWLGALEFLTNLKDTKERDLRFKNGYPQIYYQFLSNIVHSGYQDIITPIPNTSATAARYFKAHDIKADLIYVDASHEYEDVKADIENYSTLLNDGGVMFGDDYSWPGVFRAVNELLPHKRVVDSTYWING